MCFHGKEVQFIPPEKVLQTVSAILFMYVQQPEQKQKAWVTLKSQ